MADEAIPMPAVDPTAVQDAVNDAEKAKVDAAIAALNSGNPDVTTLAAKLTELGVPQNSAGALAAGMVQALIASKQADAAKMDAAAAEIRSSAPVAETPAAPALQIVDGGTPNAVTDPATAPKLEVVDGGPAAATGAGGAFAAAIASAETAVKDAGTGVQGKIQEILAQGLKDSATRGDANTPDGAGRAA